MGIDRQPVHGSNEETAWRHAGAARGWYETVWDLFTEAQKRQAVDTKDFFESTFGHLKPQAKSNLDASEGLVEHAPEGERTVRSSPESRRMRTMSSSTAYFFYYRENVRAAESDVRQE